MKIPILLSFLLIACRSESASPIPGSTSNVDVSTFHVPGISGSSDSSSTSGVSTEVSSSTGGILDSQLGCPCEIWESCMNQAQDHLSGEACA